MPEEQKTEPPVTEPVVQAAPPANVPQDPPKTPEVKPAEVKPAEVKQPPQAPAPPKEHPVVLKIKAHISGTKAQLAHAPNLQIKQQFQERIDLLESLLK